MKCEFWEGSDRELAVRVYTHNIRYATTRPAKGEVLWAKRKHAVAESIRFHTTGRTSVVCLQEVLYSQLLDLLKLLGEDWDYYGVGRDDGRKAGEYAAVLYRTTQFKIELYKTVWLSETPEVPGKGWDAASVRVLTIVLFRHKASGRNLYVLNTHLDDQGRVARAEGAELICNIISSLEDPHTLVLAGDLNSEPNQEAYPVLAKALADGRHAPGVHLYGDDNTFTGFDDTTRRKRIDYVFADPSLVVENYAVLPNRFDDGMWTSDHRPVIADVIVKGKVNRV
ncbi:Endonuclease/exonuclease/phosphatase [Dipodascopsis tothii]|uniref:Endonuclease/exonuclease/phosphatase n=1 Tax=Dipodascopsis tothii TaxID=44089 RepID=UPI0034CF186F